MLAARSVETGASGQVNSLDSALANIYDTREKI